MPSLPVRDVALSVLRAMRMVVKQLTSKVETPKSFKFLVLVHHDLRLHWQDLRLVLTGRLPVGCHS
jgi:hypothetical protein